MDSCFRSAGGATENQGVRQGLRVPGSVSDVTGTFATGRFSGETGEVLVRLAVRGHGTRDAAQKLTFCSPQHGTNIE